MLAVSLQVSGSGYMPVSPEVTYVKRLDAVYNRARALKCAHH